MNAKLSYGYGGNRGKDQKNFYNLRFPVVECLFSCEAKPCPTGRALYMSIQSSEFEPLVTFSISAIALLISLWL